MPSAALPHDERIDPDAYVPALWVPVGSYLRARRRLLTMADRISEAIWQQPSAIDGWSRKHVLAHLVTWEAQYQRALHAILHAAPLASAPWSPDAEACGLDIDAWNAREVDRHEATSLAELRIELEAASTETLRLLTQLADHQLLQPFGFVANVLAGLHHHIQHDNAHADHIVNGPQMMR